MIAFFILTLIILGIIMVGVMRNEKKDD